MGGGFDVFANTFEQHTLKNRFNFAFISVLNCKDRMTSFDTCFLSCAANLNTCRGLVCFLGCQSSWQPAAECQRPPRGSTLACPRCLAGDRSDTEANTCSSEEGDLAKCWPPLLIAHTFKYEMYITAPDKKGHGNRTLRSMFPAGRPSLALYFSLHPLQQTAICANTCLHPHTRDPESTRTSFVVSAVL